MNRRGRHVGVDLGGTKIEAAVFDLDEDRFVEVRRERIETRRHEGYDAIVRRTCELARAMRAAGGGAAPLPVGIGMPGGVERRTGNVKNANTTALNGRPFRRDVAAALGGVVAFENDANCFALAEATYGAAREARSGVVFGVILGTGVGGGLVIEGRARTGLHGIAGEWGHHALRLGFAPSYPCYCGKEGCVETYLSGPAVEAGAAGPVAAAAEETRARVSATDILDRPATDAQRAARERWLEAFGRAMANVIDVVDPDAIVLGGGLSRAGAPYDEGRARVAKYVFNDELLTPILRPALGDAAGVLGAALLP